MTPLVPFMPTAAPANDRHGLIDGLAWPLKARDFAGWLNPLWSSDPLRARIVSVQRESDDCRTLVLQPGRGWKAPRPGQHVLVGVNLDGTRQTRAFSLSAAPQRNGRVSLTVKQAREGGVSEHLVRRARVGELLTLSLPQGDFVLPSPVPRRMLCITGGSGITPVRAMLQALAARGQLWDVTHIHYEARPVDLIYRTELTALESRERGYRLHRLFTRTAQPDARFSRAQLEALCPDWARRDAFACGPAPLLDALTATWAEAGLGAQLHMERFQAVRAPAAVVGEGVTGAVRFARSDRETPSDGQTALLLLAEQLGLKPAHGCRMGICHGCDTTLVAGRVRDLRTGTLHDQPGQRVQPCVCAAVGDATLDL